MCYGIVVNTLIKVRLNPRYFNGNWHSAVATAQVIQATNVGNSETTEGLYSE